MYERAVSGCFLIYTYLLPIKFLISLHLDLAENQLFYYFKN